MANESGKTKSDHYWEAFGHFGKALEGCGCAIMWLIIAVAGLFLLFPLIRSAITDGH